MSKALLLVALAACVVGASACGKFSFVDENVGSWTGGCTGAKISAIDGSAARTQYNIISKVKLFYSAEMGCVKGLQARHGWANPANLVTFGSTEYAESQLSLTNGEYITSVAWAAKDGCMSYLSLKTNKGRDLTAGSAAGAKVATFSAKKDHYLAAFKGATGNDKSCSPLAALSFRWGFDDCAAAAPAPAPAPVVAAVVEAPAEACKELITCSPGSGAACAVTTCVDGIVVATVNGKSRPTEYTCEEVSCPAAPAALPVAKPAPLPVTPAPVVEEKPAEVEKPAPVEVEAKPAVVEAKPLPLPVEAKPLPVEAKPAVEVTVEAKPAAEAVAAAKPAVAVSTGAVAGVAAAKGEAISGAIKSVSDAKVGIIKAGADLITSKINAIYGFMKPAPLPEPTKSGGRRLMSLQAIMAAKQAVLGGVMPKPAAAAEAVAAAKPAVSVEVVAAAKPAVAVEAVAAAKPAVAAAEVAPAEVVKAEVKAEAKPAAAAKKAEAKKANPITGPVEKKAEEKKTTKKVANPITPKAETKKAEAKPAVAAAAVAAPAPSCFKVCVKSGATGFRQAIEQSTKA